MQKGLPYCHTATLNSWKIMYADNKISKLKVSSSQIG